MSIVYHIAERDTWRAAVAPSGYVDASLSAEGFIHCSTPEQVLHVANAFFRGRTGLVLLTIDTSRLRAEIRYENLEGGTELYPHLYGPLNLDAVVSAVPFEPDETGRFVLPPPPEGEWAGV